jgi:hypothetical protein
MTWHQWHQTADIDKSTGFFSRFAFSNASADHSFQSISPALFARGEKRNAGTGSLGSGCRDSIA